jgi:chitinase
MIKQIFNTIFLLSFLSAVTFAQNVVGYYYASNSAYPHTAINFSNLTHIAHAFISPTTSGEIQKDSWFLYPELVEAAHANNVKIIAAIGGWGNSGGFSDMAADSISRNNFVNNVVNFCKTYGYDGVDLDWEYPGANSRTNDKANLVKLVTRLRESFNTNGLEIISAALPSSDWNNGYDIPALANLLDWFGIMTYDFSGPWESLSGINSPLYKNPQQYGSAHESINYYIGKGVPLEKLNLGLPFYGYSFNTSGPFKAYSGASSITYANADAKKLSGGFNYYWDEISKVPYLIDADGTTFITYDDTVSIKLKLEYIHKRNLGGTIIWKIGQDYVGGKADLLDITGKYMFTVPQNVPAIPQLSSPTNELAMDTMQVEFIWSPVDWTTSYSIQVAEDKSFVDLVINENNISLTEYKTNKLDNSETYYWRIKAANIAGSGEWSETWSFTTPAVTVVKDIYASVNEGIKLFENYPNPFNPSTKIRFDINEQSFVTLKVYNSLGQEVRELISNIMNSGSYEFNFNASGLPTGVYSYALIVGDYVSTKKMLFLK